MMHYARPTPFDPSTRCHVRSANQRQLCRDAGIEKPIDDALYGRGYSLPDLATDASEHKSEESNCDGLIRDPDGRLYQIRQCDRTAKAAIEEKAQL